MPPEYTAVSSSTPPSSSAAPPPRRGGGPGAGVVLAFLLLASLGLARVLVHPDQVLDFNDGNIETVLNPAFSLPGALLRVWDNQTFFGQSGGQFAVCTASLGEWWFGPHHYRREFVALILGLVGGALYWMLRQFGFSRLASAFAGGAVMLGGSCFTFAALGLATRAAALGFAALSVGFIERGRREGRWLPYAAAGGCLGLAISETPDIGALFALTIAAVFVGRHWPERGAPARWPALGGRFLLLVGASVVLAWQTLHVMFATQIQGVRQGAAEDPSARYDWATQWSLPPEETWNLVAGTFFGTTMRSEAAPYRGRIGRTPGWEKDPRRGFRNFSLTGHHLGVVPSALLLAAAFMLPAVSRERRRLAWMAVVGVGACLVLAWGRYTPVYRAVFALPYFSTIRNPEKWMMPLLLLATPLLATAAEALWMAVAEPSRPEGRRARTAAVAAAVAVGAVAAALLLSAVASKEAFVAGMAAEGYSESQGLAAWSTAVRSCVKVIVLVGGFVAGLRIAERLPRLSVGGRRAVAAAAMGLLTAGDLWAVNAHYVAGRRYRHVLEPNPLSAYLEAHRAEGRFKLAPPEHPLLNHLRMSYVQVSGCDLFDPVSVSRMPTDYAALFEALAPSPMRLWSLGGVRHFLTLPGGCEQLDQADGGRGRFREVFRCAVAQRDGAIVPVGAAPPDQQILRGVEFSGARPKFFWPARVISVEPGADGDRQALARLAAADFDPLQEAVIHAAGASTETGGGRVAQVLRDAPAEAAVDVEADAPAWLIRTTRFDPAWQVRIDGAPAPLARADYLLQAVQVPPGRHRIEWEFRPGRGPLCVAAAGRVGWLALLGLCLRPRRPPAP